MKILVPIRRMVLLSGHHVCLMENLYMINPMYENYYRVRQNKAMEDVNNWGKLLDKESKTKTGWEVRPTQAWTNKQLWFDWN